MTTGNSQVGWPLMVALLPGGIVTELKNPLDDTALDRLTLGTDAAVASYQEQRLKLETARKGKPQSTES